MSQSENNEDNFYSISPNIMGENITSDDLDTILDKYLDKDDVTEEEEELVVMYVLQLFYRSGRRKSCTQEVFEKVNDLIAGRAIVHLKGLDVIDEFYSNEHDDFVYKLNEKGRDLIRNENDSL